MTTDLILYTFDPAPAAHHERVISCYDSYNVDALGLEFVIFRQVRWEMVYVTGWL